VSSSVAGTGAMSPMPDCRLCGAPIRYAKLADGRVLTLDANESYEGAERYVITDYEKWTAELVKPGPAVGAHKLHAEVCSQSSR
jgi:hypothetical protein